MPRKIRAVQTPDAVAYRWPIRVYYEDTDAGGIVYYANFLKFFERCRTEWLRAAGADQSALRDEAGLQFVVTSLNTEYRRPARLDDLLVVDAAITAASGAAIAFDQRAWRDDELLAQASVKVACVDAQRMRPTRLPADLVERMRNIARGIGRLPGDGADKNDAIRSRDGETSRRETSSR